jgi:large repetitive protein
MRGWPAHMVRRRAAAIAVLATALGLPASLMLASPAFAESVTSPTGMVAMSVPPPVVAGVASTYTMTVTNTTPVAFAGPVGIVAVGEMPSGITIKSIKGCTNLGGNESTSFNCSMPNLAPGASETATFSLLASAPGDYQIPFGATGLQPIGGGEFQSVGDSATLAVTAQPGPTDIQVTGSSNNGSPPVGSTFNYTFQVKNNGPLPAAGVTFDDPLPAAIALGSTLTVDNGTCAVDAAANSVHCDIGSLNVGQQSDITFSATPTAAGSFGNTATVAMTGTDTQPANNSVTVTVQPR